MPATTTIVRPGQVNATGATDSMFLKVFSGEVLTAFEETNVMMPLHRVRTLKGAKSAQFPVTGLATAAYLTPGVNILDPANSMLSTIRGGERTIAADKLLTANTMIYRLDEIKNHWDERCVYAEELGKALAVKTDKTLLQVLLKASRVASDALFTGSKGGAKVTAATALTDGAVLLSALLEAAQKLDEKDVPKANRHCVLKTQAYWTLIKDKTLVDRDYTSGNGGIAEGAVYRAAGFILHPTNHMPSTNLTAVDNYEASASAFNDYTVDASNLPVALCFTPDAIGSVKMLDLAMEMQYKQEFKGHLTSADMAVGHGILRPECAVEIAPA